MHVSQNIWLFKRFLWNLKPKKNGYYFFNPSERLGFNFVLDSKLK